MAQPLYKSEVYVPIHQDKQSFEERQSSLWHDMQERMERRRREWQSEVEHMRRDFFRLKPSDIRRGSSDNLLESMGLDNIFYDDHSTPVQGAKTFRVSFDVSQFRPDEISVRTQEQKLLVEASHKEAVGSKRESRQFSRTLDIPKHLDPSTLTCTLSSDGILQVEAPVSQPEFDLIKSSARQPLLRSEPRLPMTSSIGPVVTEQDGSRTFKMAVDVGPDYLPQDVTVKTVDNKLLVHARHEHKEPGRTSFKEFKKEYDLPAEVDPNTVTASMSEDGRLLVEAPMSSYSKGSYQGRPGSTKQPTVYISMTK